MTETQRIIPLSHVHVGRTAIVREVEGGRGLVSRLATLGFTPGAQLTMIQNYGHGPLIVSIRDSRIALGRGEADKVLVSVAGDGNSDKERGDETS